MRDRELKSSSAPAVEKGPVATTPGFAGQSFAVALREASRAGWSGAFELRAGNHLVAGTAVLDRGYLAWATSMAQPETLGSFLYRLGHVTRDDLDIMKALFEDGGGEKKLGRLAEEAGIIPRQVLRRCLLLHVRLAVTSLLDPKVEVVSARAGSFCVEQEMLFPVTEVLPEWSSSTVPGALAEGPTDAATLVLESLKAIPGHRGCLVADRAGTPLCTRGFSAGDVPGPTVLATTALTLLESSTHAATWSSLGSVDFASSEGSEGSLLVHWLDGERSLLAAVLLDPRGKVGVARYELASAAASFQNQRTGSALNGS